MKVAIARPPGYELPTAIVERAELLTMVSASGRSQTVARFQLRSKAQLIEVRLPTGSTLWSAYLDGTPTQPQREADSLLIELPAAAEARRRNLQLVYETPVNALGMASSLDLAAPKLLLRDEAERGGRGSAARGIGVAIEHARWIQGRAQQWNRVQRRYRGPRVAADACRCRGGGASLSRSTAHAKPRIGPSRRSSIVRPPCPWKKMLNRPHNHRLAACNFGKTAPATARNFNVHEKYAESPILTEHNSQATADKSWHRAGNRASERHCNASTGYVLSACG